MCDGNVDSAKSTLISTLTHRILDDGRGLARKRVFKHKHNRKVVEPVISHLNISK